METQKNDLEKKTLREWRLDAGLTQRELGEFVDSSQGHLSTLEFGIRSSDTMILRKIAQVLDISIDQILPAEKKPQVPEPDYRVDGLSPEAPRRDLRWWRERRYLGIRDLAYLSGVNESTILRLEQFVLQGRGKRKSQTRPMTRRKLCEVLKVSPDKLALPGDDPVVEDSQKTEDVLRAELRGVRRMLRRSYDFLRDDANITFKALDKRDVLLGDVEQEIKGI